MSETNNYDPNMVPRSEILTELPVEISPERAHEVGNYFTQILDEHGKPAEIPIGGKLRVGMWEGQRAEFDAGDRKLTVEKLTDPLLADRFPETVATMYEKGKSGWEMGDRFLYNMDNKGSLSYRRGKTLLYQRSERPLKPGIEGVQSLPRWRNLTVNVTPPTSEGVVDTLGMFLKESGEVIAKSTRIREKARKLGRHATKLTRRAFLME